MTPNNQNRRDHHPRATTTNETDAEQVGVDELGFDELETDADFERLEKLLSTVRIPAELTHRFEDQTDRCLILPGFRHLTFLGRGGFGYVYLAEDERLGRRVAIKVPRSRPFDGDDQLERTMREARVVATLKHPGIVPLYEAILYNGECCLVSEYVEGGTLEQQLADGPIETVRAIELARQIAEALAHAHQQNIVHRDLKPQNILIDGDGRPRITDFGLAIRDDQQAAELGMTAGTLEYLAPEQLPGAGQYMDGRTDIWAFGVILYRMLTGRLPFGGNRGPELLHEIAQRAPKPPRQLVPEIPVELERICLRCLAKSPQDRFSSAAEIVPLLRQVNPTPAPKPLRFKSWFAVALATLLVATVLGVIVTLAWQPTRGSSTVGAASPRVEVKSMRIMRHAYSDEQTGVALGAIGITSDHAQFDDDIRIDIQFSEPAYSYVLEFSCNGQLLLHDPEDPQQAPTARSELTVPSPPSSTESLNYLALVDGTGLYVFCVIASHEQLPPFAEWQRRVGTIPWQTCQAEGVWRFSHQGLGAGHFLRERSSQRQRAAPPAPLATLCDYLREHAPGATIEAIAFPVLPKERAVNATATLVTGTDSPD